MEFTQALDPGSFWLLTGQAPACLDPPTTVRMAIAIAVGLIWLAAVGWLLYTTHPRYDMRATNDQRLQTAAAVLNGLLTNTEMRLTEESAVEKAISMTDKLIARVGQKKSPGSARTETQGR